MLEYRRELDGLRALAVIAVLFYHANFMLWKTPLMRGGFLGVDVFFVLSGFLITGIIRYAMDNGSFRFLDFYLRRFRRIVPALLVILTISALGAWFVLFSGDLIKFAESLRSALYFGSNYYFYGEDSYTALASIFKPLLHTWSLAVEWQFYIVYPFVFWFLYRYFPRYCPVILVGLAVVSLCYAQWQSMVSPDWSFYFLPTRAWELLFGGVLVFVRRDALPPVCRRIGKWMPLLGFVMLMVSMVSFSDKITHPSFLTFIPVAGTMLIIVFAREDDWITRGLSWRPVVYIGLISYSIYLWHQPVFVYFRILKYEQIRPFQFIILSTVCIGLASLSYWLVESPFRKKTMIWPKTGFLACLLAACAIFAQNVIAHNGYPDRFGIELEKQSEDYKQGEFERLMGPTPGKSYYKNDPVELCWSRTVDSACHFGDESWVTLGDSFAGVFDYVLHERLSALGKGHIVLTYTSCPFMSEDIWVADKPECPVVNEDRWKLIRSFKTPKHFLVTANFMGFDEVKRRVDNPYERIKNRNFTGEIVPSMEGWRSFAANINRLIDMGHQVTVVYPVPLPDIDVKNEVLRQLRNDRKLHKVYGSRKQYDKAMEYTATLDSVLPDRKGLTKVRPMDVFCEKDGRCLVIDEQSGIYNKNGHLSHHAAEVLIDNYILPAGKH